MIRFTKPTKFWGEGSIAGDGSTGGGAVGVDAGESVGEGEAFETIG